MDSVKINDVYTEGLETITTGLRQTSRVMEILCTHLTGIQYMHNHSFLQQIFALAVESQSTE